LKGLSIIGVPTNSAGKKGGVAGAPAALRRAGLVGALGKINKVHDEGDVPFSTPTTERDAGSGIIAYGSLASMIRGVRASVGRVLLEGRFPLVVGGDCPVLLGCLAAAHPTGLLFVDGHEDAYPAHESPTGEAADMELGFALGREVPDLIKDAVGPVPLVDSSKIVMLGPRDKKVLQKTNTRSLDDGSIKFYDDGALRKGNIEALARRAVRHLALGRLWLHVDLDVLSTRSLPAVDYQQPGGLSWNQLERLTSTILSSGKVVGMNVTIYNPDRDPDGRFARRIVKYLQTAMRSRTVP
jgi:arginase